MKVKCGAECNLGPAQGWAPPYVLAPAWSCTARSIRGLSQQRGHPSWTLQCSMHNISRVQNWECLPVKRRSARLRSGCFERIGFKQTLCARTVRSAWPQEDRRSHVLGIAVRARPWRDQAHLRSRGRPHTASEARTGRACQPRRHQSTLHQLGWVRATRTRMHTTAGEDSRRLTRMGPLARVRFC